MREFTFQTIDDPVVIEKDKHTFYPYNIKRNRLFNEQFVTYKRIRKDRDWLEREEVIITLSPVAKPHIQLGVAKIISINKKSENHFIYPETTSLSADELTYEGFDMFQEWQFRREYFGDDYHDVKVFNKIKLEWINWNPNMIKMALEVGDFRI